MTDEEFYSQDRIEPMFPGNVRYMKTLNKKFFNFKVISIDENASVKEHFWFVHPVTYKSEE